jgi:hypothetical protein
MWAGALQGKSCPASSVVSVGSPLGTLISRPSHEAQDLATRLAARIRTRSAQRRREERMWRKNPRSHDRLRLVPVNVDGRAPPHPPAFSRNREARPGWIGGIESGDEERIRVGTGVGMPGVRSDGVSTGGRSSTHSAIVVTVAVRGTSRSRAIFPDPVAGPCSRTGRTSRVATAFPYRRGSTGRADLPTRRSPLPIASRSQTKGDSVDPTRRISFKGVQR